MKSSFKSILVLLFGSLLAHAAIAQEAVIRKNLTERLAPFPVIDAVTKTDIPGIWEVRSGNHVLYSDKTGNYLFQGNIIDTKRRIDLTQARIDKLTEIDFASLPLKDALVMKQGTGARKLVVFADPNCGYCKHFESDLQQIKDVTIYTFLYPVLGGDSPAKSRNIWCASNHAMVWRNWMIDGTAAPTSIGGCDSSAIERNLALGQKYNITGTPSLVFEDGKRVPGALPAVEVEKQLIAAGRPKG